jgi:hypothetical protein
MFPFEVHIKQQGENGSMFIISISHYVACPPAQAYKVDT